MVIESVLKIIGNYPRLFNIKIGYLFQNFALIDDVSVYENLNIVQSLGNKSEKRQKIIEALRRVGFEEEVLKQKNL